MRRKVKNLKTDFTQEHINEVLRVAEKSMMFNIKRYGVQVLVTANISSELSAAAIPAGENLGFDIMRCFEFQDFVDEVLCKKLHDFNNNYIKEHGEQIVLDAQSVRENCMISNFGGLLDE